MESAKESFDDFEYLRELMAILRSEGGCPWDREQTLETLKPYCLEEAREVCSAIDRVLKDGSDEDWVELSDELGDLLLQVVFQAQIASEAGRFDLDDVVRGIVEKLIRRHPHVFRDAEAETSDDVLANWEVIKAAEKVARMEGRTLTPGEAESLLDSEG